MRNSVAILILLISIVKPTGARADLQEGEKPRDDLQLIEAVAVEAENDTDLHAFRQMLRASLHDSPTVRRLLAELASERTSAVTIKIVLVRNSPGVLIDSFQRNLIDLDDLERLPSVHAPDLDRNVITREEQLVHILAERQHAARMLSRLPGDVHDLGISSEQLFSASHEIGVLYENRYRAERGQVPLADAIFHMIRNSPGDAVTEYTLTDGSICYLISSHYGTIEQVIPPIARRIALRR